MVANYETTQCILAIHSHGIFWRVEKWLVECLRQPKYKSKRKNKDHKKVTANSLSYCLVVLPLQWKAILMSWWPILVIKQVTMEGLVRVTSGGTNLAEENSKRISLRISLLWHGTSAWRTEA